MEDILKHYTEKLDRTISINEETPCIILYKGKQLVLDSGKSAWKNRANAASALTNHLGGINWRDRDEWREKYGKKRLSQVLEEEKIVEFKSIEI